MTATPTRRRRGNAARPPTRQPDTPPRRRRTLLVGVAVAALSAAAITTVVVTGGDDDTVLPDPDRVAELEQQESERDVAQVEELITLTEDTHDAVADVVGELDTALPPDGGSGPVADSDTVGEWRDTLADVATDLEDPPSGSSEYNVARTGLKGSIDLLVSSVSAYDMALDGDDLDPELTELASSLRTQAVNAWSVSATQLDLLAVEAELGHVHLYLDSVATEDAMAPDAHPEGVHDEH
ncbi:hypothetical protein J4H86_06090 [Spiractinospora alimapuensis]|uniref:hypothetical protein n=1 Tax=Spiractinospora alimapuensis TaxID=2820884 RepID=UPI001F1FC68C|nr:hypothetical protein [Spiractinospora alimapuensis]QVQ53335.1 hypothetical protein J4H86_06090 [Spiractinospora alimapuensis]